ncbi:MAG: hypothetical protein WBC48_00710 [Minisyncoccales bacterium]
MNLKSKILAAGLAAIIAGFGIFATNINTAQAQTDSEQTDSAIAQMMQMIETLKQQIQQIIALIAQLKPQETCGNGKCRFGETAATCPADCGQQIADCAKEGEVFVNDSKQCCSGLEKMMSNGQRACQVGRECPVQTNYTCRSAKCGDNTCSAGEKCLRDCNIVDGKSLIKVSGNGFALGDIVSIKTASPQKNDIVYYDAAKNDNYCMAMGPGLSLNVIKGLPGQTVVFGDDYMKIGDETISIGNYARRAAVFGGIKYDSLAGRTIVLAQNEYLLDGWIGQQCFAGDITDQGSKAYGRFTVNEDAIIAIIGAKVGHDSAYEEEMRSVVY